jgi:hypothetical protein
MRVDCTPPAVSVDRAEAEVEAGQPVEPVVAAEDATSGLATVVTEVSVDGEPWVAATTPRTAEAGRSYVFRSRAVDVAGNWSGWVEAPAVVGVAPPEEELPVPVVVEPPVEVLAGGPVPAVEEPPIEPAEAAPEPEPEPEAHRVQMAPAGEEPGLPADPRLRITRVLARANGRVDIAGTAARGLAANATVRIRIGRRVLGRNAVVRGGRWGVRVRAKSGRRVTGITISTPAAAGFTAGTARWRR